MVRDSLFRIATAALALTALSFGAGVVGDLSSPARANSGVRVVLRLPPPLPAPSAAAEALPVAVAIEDAA